MESEGKMQKGAPPMLKRVAILFSGGPAPGANAVISAAASAFLRGGTSVIGILNGYSSIQDYDAESRPLVEGQDYIFLQPRDLRGQRNSRGIMLGTARAHPGREVRCPADLHSPQKTARIARVFRSLRDLEVDALISIGGDGTLMTANTLHRYQDTLPESTARIRVVHVPKTIDNDYSGIDFTFGFFTAVDVMSKSLLNLRADAIATRSYFVVEVMGRTAGWLGYGVSIAGEAHMVIGVEDVVGDLVDEAAGPRACAIPVYLDLDALCDRIHRLINVREAQGKQYGVIVLTEGLVELLPPHVVAGLPQDEHGMISLASLNIGKLVAERISRRRQEQGCPKKVTGVQLGYEARCAMPHAFDVVLGCQLGQGAWRALEEEEADAVMVSMTGQMQHRVIPFSDLVDAETLQTTTRLIEPSSDFHRLAHGLATRLKT
jgi:6-phosphofructokinase